MQSIIIGIELIVFIKIFLYVARLIVIQPLLQLLVVVGILAPHQFDAPVQVRVSLALCPCLILRL